MLMVHCVGLADECSSVLPFPRLHWNTLRWNNLSKLSAWIYFRIWTYFVASDYGCKGSKITIDYKLIKEKKKMTQSKVTGEMCSYWLSREA